VRGRPAAVGKAEADPPLAPSAPVPCRLVRRAYMIGLIALGVVLFLVISAFLARVLSLGGAEDTALTQLVRDEARGDLAAVVSDIRGCRSDRACQARAAANIAGLKHQGSIQIAEINGSAGFSLTSTVGTARVAWVAGNSLPRVQCVRVRRAGDVLSGFRIELLKVSLRIKSSADCPRSY
jgi:hypothetical protein